MKNTLLFFQILTAAVLVVVILIQSKGTGFGRAWGSTNTSFTRRGLEKVVFRLTFVISFVFILISVLQLIV